MPNNALLCPKIVVKSDLFSNWESNWKTLVSVKPTLNFNRAFERRNFFGFVGLFLKKMYTFICFNTNSYVLNDYYISSKNLNDLIKIIPPFRIMFSEINK